MKKVFIIITAFIFSSVPVYGAITGQSGTCTNGNACTFSGSGFGTGATIYTWIGPDNLDSGSGTFSAPDWLVGTCGTCAAPTYTTDQHYSGTKSVGIMGYTSTIYQGIMQYGFGTQPSSVYISFRRYKHAGSATNWQDKIFRFMNGTDVQDGDGQLILTQWIDGNKYRLVWCSLASPSQCYPDNDYGLRNNNDGFPLDAWGRYELIAIPSSLAGQKDGTFRFYVHNASGIHTENEWNGTIMSAASGVTNKWLWATFQNYIGEGGDTENRQYWKVYMSDIYIASSPARVEIGDKSTWSTCTHRDISPHTEWSSGSVTVTLTIGSFSSEEISSGLYVYLVDSTGAPISTDGFLITLGEVPVTQHTLTITKSGTGSGTVTEAGGIDCGETCEETKDEGYEYSNVPTADEGSYFVGWSGDCSGVGNGTGTLTEDKTCNAQFDLLDTSKRYFPALRY